MTKVYELPNGHRMIADIDESTRVCNITETTLDSLVSKLNYYSEQTDVLDKIIAEIDEKISHYEHFSSSNTANGLMIAKKIIDKYKAERVDTE